MDGRPSLDFRRPAEALALSADDSERVLGARRGHDGRLRDVDDEEAYELEDAGLLGQAAERRSSSSSDGSGLDGEGKPRRSYAADQDGEFEEGSFASIIRRVRPSPPPPAAFLPFCLASDQR